tara:strand:- start:518 stop:700 length:183 start_codon:yes stop_codon:yes gene_type:complete
MIYKEVENSDEVELAAILKTASNDALTLSLMIEGMSNKQIREKIKYIRKSLKRVSEMVKN